MLYAHLNSTFGVSMILIGNIIQIFSLANFDLFFCFFIDTVK